ncbi:MAG: hypothetical protein ACOCZC_03535 [Halodesulfurarchaeum sp.]
MNSRTEPATVGPPTPGGSNPGTGLQTTAREMAKQVIQGFQAHDDGRREDAIDAFAAVDVRQFRHLDEDDARLAAKAYVEALFEKDEVEFAYLKDGDIDAEGLAEADWSPVRKQFRLRAAVAGIDSEYAVASTEAWKYHKTGGDYWTPVQRAQMLELRCALQDPEYPHKPRWGQSGFGPEPARYALAIELHDMRDPAYVRQAVDVMVPYFTRILREHTHDHD